jgi:tetratricopeptide (TPR) repeat protein
VVQPDLAAAYYSRASLYMTADRYQEAVADLDQVLDADPFHANGYYLRGIAHRYLGAPARARADFEEALMLTDDPSLRARVEQELAALEP